MKYLFVGGPLHGTHREVGDIPSHTVLVPPPLRAIFASATDDDSMVILPLQYRRQRVVSSGRRAEVYHHGPYPADPLLLVEAIRMRGLPGVITALLPSRGRSNGPLQESIESLWAAAGDSTRVEILVAADDGDGPTAEACKAIGVRCISTPRYGYSRLNEYFNRLADIASGEWLMLWNDDARMETLGWDSILDGTPKEVLIADPWVQGHSPDLCTFPILRRHVLHKAGGVYSPVTCHCDTWWQDIGRQLGVLKPVEIRIDHQRSDLRPGMHADQTRREAMQGYRSADFYGDHVQAMLNQQTERIGLALREERHR